MSEMALDLIRRAKAEGWKRLDLGNTGIVGEVPAEIWELTELEELILSKEWVEMDRGLQKSQNTGPENKISAFPAHLILPSNQKDTPEQIAASAAYKTSPPLPVLARLQKLVLANSQVANVQALAQLRNLRTLDLTNTQVADIQSLAHLVRLNQLYLWNTQVVDIHPLAHLRRLTYINLSSTPVADIRPLAQLRKLTRLDLRSTQVADIKPLAQLRKLVYLDLEDTQVHDIQSLTQLHQLNYLFLGRTAVDDLQPLANLKSITTLHLHNTQVADIKSLSQLSQLAYLDLASTLVADIQSLARLPQLAYLDLEGTQVADLQPLVLLQKLTRLNLSRTRVVDIQPLAQLNNLRELYLDHTVVTDIQPLAGLMKKGLGVTDSWHFGNVIHIEGCPLSNPPYEIAIQGNPAILDWWRDEARKGNVSSKALKLFLLGNTTAGKSTLAHVLIHEEYPQSTFSTLGADLSQTWELDDKQVRIWDFGGQEFFHATYRLLMNDSAVYVVIVDPERDRDGSSPTEIHYKGKTASEMEELEHFPHIYWLENVRTYAPNSNALVLWNKITIDDCSSLMLDSSAKAMFTGDAKVMAFPSDLWGIFHDQDPEWEAMWRVFHNQLKREIDSRLSKNGTIIAYYPDIRSVIDNLALGRIWMSLHELEGICREFDDTPTIGNILTYLSDMCGAIFFRKPQSDDLNALPERVFINPNRLNQLFYAILNWDTKQAGGHFTRDFAIRQVEQELDKMGVSDVSQEDLPGFVHELLGLMKQFEIIFEVEEGKQQALEDDKEMRVDEWKERFVAPQYLPQDAPAQLQREKKIAKIEPKLFIKFSSYIPGHIIPRFISKNGIFAKDELYWKFGVLYFVDEKSNMAMVHVDYKSRIIAVEVGEHQDSVTILRDILAQLRVLIGKDDLFTVSEDGQTYYPIKDPVLRTPERLIYIIGIEGISRAPSEEASEVYWRKIDQKLDVIVGQNAHTHHSLDEIKNMLQPIKERINDLLDSQSELRDHLLLMLGRLDDKSEQTNQWLESLHALQEEMQVAIDVGMSALSEHEVAEIKALIPENKTSFLAKTGDAVKLKFGSLALVAALLATQDPEAASAIPPILAASAIDVETTLSGFWKGFAKILRKAYEPFKLD